MGLDFLAGEGPPPRGWRISHRWRSAAAIVVILALTLAGCGRKKPPVEHPDKSVAQENDRQIDGRYDWENTSAFRAAFRKAKARLRLSSFETTLPDPLPGEEDNVALAADMLAGTIVQPGLTFSMNGAIGPYTAWRGFGEGPVYLGTEVGTTIGGGICKVATTIYNVAILANLPVVERHPHGMLVPYVPPGQDATVTYASQDIKFENDTGAPLLIWADTKGRTLYMAFYGQKAPPEVTWHHQVLERRPYPTVYRPENPGKQMPDVPGAEGMTVRSWLTVRYEDGRTVTKQLGVDRYVPMPKVVRTKAGS